MTKLDDLRRAYDVALRAWARAVAWREPARVVEVHQRAKDAARTALDAALKASLRRAA